LGLGYLEFGKIGKSNSTTIPYIPPHSFLVQELIIQEVSCDFIDGFHFVDFELLWLVEVIETDGAPVV